MYTGYQVLETAFGSARRRKIRDLIERATEIEAARRRQRIRDLLQQAICPGPGES